MTTLISSHVATNTMFGANLHHLVNVCPKDDCNLIGGCVIRKEVRNGKTSKAYHYYYFEHHLSRTRRVSHYLGRTRPSIKHARVETTLVVLD
jgi:hypothetical protein